jgi:ABC-type multidrug transport system fused ATPase/permease subunit
LPLKAHTDILEYARLLNRYLRPHWIKAILLAITLFTSIGLQLVGPQILRHFIDAARAGVELEVLGWAALIYLLLAVANQAFSAGATYLGADIGWSSTNELRRDLAGHCIRLDMGFHNNRTPGELIERIDGDVTNLSNFFSQFMIQIFGSVLLTIGVLILLLRESLVVGFGLAFFAVLTFYVLIKLRDFAMPVFQRQQEARAKFFGFLEEKLAALDDLRANGGLAYVLDRFYRRNYTNFHLSRKSWMLRSCIFLALMLLFAMANVLAIGVGIYLHRAFEVSVGTVFLFFIYTEMLRIPVMQLTRQLQDLQNAGASIIRINELIRMRSALPEDGREPLTEGPLSIQFDHTTFEYRESVPVLRDVNLDLAPGRVLGIIGTTGSGKTTLTRLLFRLYDAQRGAVRVGGHDVKDIDISDLRHRIGLVTQDVQLFHGTIRDNITFFNRKISDEQIRSIVRELGIGAWLERLPDGLDTMLYSGGQGVSAGEAQLLAFIRVFLKDPGLVILDEPSSRMDPASETLLHTAWHRLLKNRTGIVIAHRLSTVRSADEILVLEEGHVREHDQRETLERDPSSRFSELLRTGSEVLF